MPVLKGQDILVLLRLISEPADWTVRSLGKDLSLDPAGVHRALRRLDEARLIDLGRRRVNRANVEEFLLHGFKYAFPVRQQGLTRGVPTAWAAAPLRDAFAPSDDPPPVWPHPRGDTRGIALEPLHENVPQVAVRNPRLGEQLALLDAIRMGDARARALAASQLRERIRAGAVAAS